MRRTLCAVLFAMAVFVPSASSQQPAQRQVDSLAAQVRQLRAKLDRPLATMGARPSQAAGPKDTVAAADTANTPFVGRERNQSQLNPEIGVTGDVRAYAYPGDVQRNNFDPREFEIGFQSALDPYSH